MASAQNQNDTPKGGYAILLVPLVIASVLLFAGWLVARLGASYKTTRAVLAPAIFFIANFFAVMPFVCIGWVIALILQNTPMANYVVGKAPELCLLSSLFGDPISVPVWHILLYQLYVWWFFARHLVEPITTFIYDIR